MYGPTHDPRLLKISNFLYWENILQPVRLEGYHDVVSKQVPRVSSPLTSEVLLVTDLLRYPYRFSSRLIIPSVFPRQNSRPIIRFIFLWYLEVWVFYVRPSMYWTVFRTSSYTLVLTTGWGVLQGFHVRLVSSKDLELCEILYIRFIHL